MKFSYQLLRVRVKLKWLFIWLTPRRALLIGFSSILIAPWLFTRTWGFIKFGQATGTIGDTIGGLTAPITGLLGAFLVYKALKEQVHANNIITNQFKQQISKESQERTIQLLFQRISLIREDIRSFVYSTVVIDFDPEYMGEVSTPRRLEGIAAIGRIIADRKSPSTHKYQRRHEEMGYKQFSHLLSEMSIVFFDIEFSDLPNKETKHLNTLLSNTFYIYIYPVLNEETEYLDDNMKRIYVLLLNYSDR